MIVICRCQDSGSIAGHRAKRIRARLDRPPWRCYSRSPTKRIPMKIVDAKVIVCCPGRNFVTLKIITDDGLYGLGDATLNGRELAVASYVRDHLVPLLIGRD